MASDDEKKHMGLIIALGGPKVKKGSDDGDGDESDGDANPHSAAADEVFDALQDGDRKDFADALHAYVELCMNSGGDDEKESY